MTLHFNEADIIIANAEELAQCGELGSTALDSIIDVLEAWRREIQHSFVAVNTVITELRLIAAPNKAKTVSNNSLQTAVAVSTDAAQASFTPPKPIARPHQYERSGSGGGNEWATTANSSVKRFQTAIPESKPAPTDVKTMLHQQQASRQVIFRLREENQWHNAGQPIKLRGELIELTFDFEVGTCCPEPGCFAKFGWNTPVLKVWPGTAVPAPASAKKTVPTQEVANNNRSPEDFRLICLRHASKPLTWEEIEVD